MSNERKKCPNCNGIYIGHGYKEVCTRECYFRREYQIKVSPRFKVKQKKVFNLVCRRCNEGFESNSAVRKYCSYGCGIASKTPTESEKIAKANEDWLNNKTKYVPKRKKSFAQLNREMEWKRVWDDESWARVYGSYRGWQ